MTELFGDAGTGRGAALTVDGRPLGREDLFDAAAVVAERVAGRPAVAVRGEATLETVVGILGCLQAGVPAVPVPADAGAAEIAHLVEDSGVTLWLGSGAPEGLASTTVDVAARTAARLPEPDPSTTALIMYTSGTTGAPKGVPASRAAIAAGLDGVARAWAWTADDVLVHGLPLFHVHGLVLGVFGALRAGSPLVHTGRPRPDRYAAAGGSLYFGVPTVWSRIAADEDAARALRGARLLVSGSASLPGPVAARLREWAGQEPIERYGMTETLITVAARADEPRRTGWVGRPIEGVSTRLRDEAGGEVPAGGLGELQVSGPTVFDGYLGRPEATAASFTEDGWFRTGDAAVIDDGGEHRIVGRLSVDLIKTGGYRVGAGEIEASLLAHPSVREAAVVGEPDDDLGQRIVAYVVGDGVDTDALIRHVGGELAAHKRPRVVHVVDSLPRNEMGKIQKGLLEPPR